MEREQLASNHWYCIL